MTNEELARLRALAEASDLDPLQSTHIISVGYTHLANLTEQIGDNGKPRGRCLAMMPKEWSDYVAAAVNAVPTLIAEVERLRAALHEIHDDKLTSYWVRKCCRKALEGKP